MTTPNWLDRSIWCGIAAVTALPAAAGGEHIQRRRGAVTEANAALPAVAYAPGTPDQAAAEWLARTPLDVMSLARGGWIQFVRFEGLNGATVEINTQSGAVRFPMPAVVGLATGMSYRCRIAGIPDRPEIELYPSLSLVGFLSPPSHVSPLDHPIRLHFELRDAMDAGRGKHIRNVVYLEDPQTAIPIAFTREDLPVLDIAPGEDALEIAGGLGRPIMLVQFGDRMPLDGLAESTVNPPVFLPHAAATPAELTTVRLNALRLINRNQWQFASGPLGIYPPTELGAPAAICRQPRAPQRLNVHPRMPDDERLVNGGDRLPYVHQNFHGGVGGVQPADTVAVYTRPGDRTRLAVANQVAVYSPRFGVVRSEWLAAGRSQVDRLYGVAQTDSRHGVDSRQRTVSDSGRLKTQHLRRTDRPARADMTELPTGLDEVRVIVAARNREGIAQYLQQTNTGRLAQSDALRLAAAIEWAAHWSRTDFPAYTARTESGGQVRGHTRTAQVYEVKPPYRRPGDIEIQKYTLTQSAQSGDVIEFHIVYRNAGEQPVEGLSIIDSLIPRLEYVPGTAQSDRGAVFTATPSDAGSQELRWDVPGLIQGGEQGVVWFKAKVR